MPQSGTVDLIPISNADVLDQSALYSASSCAQPVGKVVTDLIPTGNELRSSCAQPVGKVVLNASMQFASPVQMRGSNRE